MADFEKAFNITMGHEGGYNKDPDDAGGETYRGISRIHHPNWLGWNYIDNIKFVGTDPNQSFVFADLDSLVRSFYEDVFWNPMRLDQVSSQAVAEEMFDTGVNQGINDAVQYLQISLNVLNRNGLLYPDLVEDGKIGPKTLKALNLALSVGDEEILLIWMNVAQGWHYMAYMRRSPTQEKYARGWAKRVQIRKT